MLWYGRYWYLLGMGCSALHKHCKLLSGCGLVDREVASKTIRPPVESSYWVIFNVEHLFTINFSGEENKEKKRPGKADFLNKTLQTYFSI